MHLLALFNARYLQSPKNNSNSPKFLNVILLINRVFLGNAKKFARLQVYLPLNAVGSHGNLRHPGIRMSFSVAKCILSRK